MLGFPSAYQNSTPACSYSYLLRSCTQKNKKWEDVQLVVKVDGPGTSSRICRHLLLPFLEHSASRLRFWGRFIEPQLLLRENSTTRLPHIVVQTRSATASSLLVVIVPDMATSTFKAPRSASLLRQSAPSPFTNDVMDCNVQLCRFSISPKTPNWKNNATKTVAVQWFIVAWCTPEN